MSRDHTDLVHVRTATFTLMCRTTRKWIKEKNKNKADHPRKNRLKFDDTINGPLRFFPFSHALHKYKDINDLKR